MAFGRGTFYRGRSTRTNLHGDSRGVVLRMLLHVQFPRGDSDVPSRTWRASRASELVHASPVGSSTLDDRRVRGRHYRKAPFSPGYESALSKVRRVPPSTNPGARTMNTGTIRSK